MVVSSRLLRAHGHAAGVQEREAAGAVGRLDHAGLDAGLAHGRGLLVARHAQHRHRRAEDVGRGDAELAEQSTTLGSSDAGTPSSFSRPASQVPLWMSSSRVRLALVASLACTLPPVSRHSRKHLDRAGRQRALLRRGAAAGDVVEDPGDLGAGEIGIEDQAGLGRDLVLVAGALQRVAEVGGAAVLPDDGVVDRLAGAAVPHHRGLALVGDADAGQRRWRRAWPWRARRGRPRPWPTRSPRRRARPSRAWGRSAAVPSAPTATGRPDGVEHDGAGAGGALVDGEDVLGGHPVLSRFCRRTQSAQCARSMAKSTASSRAALSGLSGNRPSASRAMAP